MNIFAQINDGIVVNTAVWSGSPPQGWVAVPDSDPRPGVGWAYDGANFVAPATPDVPPATRLEFLDFVALFTADEQSAIVNSTDARIKLFCLMAAGSGFVDLTDIRTVQGTQLLGTLGLIGKGRAAQVLAGKESAR